MSLEDLKSVGFNVQAQNHAVAVLTRDFPNPLKELCAILLGFQIQDVELIRRGGGEAKPTQRLRTAFTDRQWIKRNIAIVKIVDGKRKSALSHEIDHVRTDEAGSIALEIEWNNKDTFFDRDLENFQRLHSEGVISVGIIITRGKSFQDGLYQIVLDWAKAHSIKSFADLGKFGLNPTVRQMQAVQLTGNKFAPAWAKRFVNDKFGTSTTHWDKLQVRIKRGVGNPCPLLLIGIPEGAIRKTSQT